MMTAHSKVAQAKTVKDEFAGGKQKTIMPFPELSRFIYDKNPLVEVICQFRFPPILKIDSEPPAAFQDRIRNEFPLFKQVAGAGRLPIPQEVLELIGRNIAITQDPAFQFITQDENDIITLTKSHITVSTKQYRRWEEFKDKFLPSIQIFLEIYSPAFFTRIGLRYRDAIQRSALGLNECKWADLLQPHISGMFANPELEGAILQSTHEVVLKLENARKVRVKHGIGSMKINGETNPENIYIIDSDFFTEERGNAKDFGESIGVLDNFNRTAVRLFRWCITDRLHAAMGPREI